MRYLFKIFCQMTQVLGKSWARDQLCICLSIQYLLFCVFLCHLQQSKKDKIWKVNNFLSANERNLMFGQIHLAGVWRWKEWEGTEAWSRQSSAAEWRHVRRHVWLWHSQWNGYLQVSEYTSRFDDIWCLHALNDIFLCHTYLFSCN